MKTFARHRTFNEVKALCKAQGLKFDDHVYKAGGDMVFVTGGGCTVAFNCATGWFCGRTPDYIEFNSTDNDHEKEPWFQALLAFFYTDDQEAA